MLRRLYDWTLRWAGHRRATSALAAISFAESSFFPIPPDVLLIPMVLAERGRAWMIALVCTIASVLGAVLGYAIGVALFDVIGAPLLEFYGYEAEFADFALRFEQWGAWIVLGAALTPFPFKVITIASGVARMDPATFILVAMFARGVRFYLVAALLWRFGVPLRAFIERYLGLLALLAIGLLLGGFIAVKYLI